MRLYSNTTFPGLSLSPIKVTGQFWSAGEDKQLLPDRDLFIERCQGDGPLCINIEHWRWDIRKDPRSVVDASIRKLCTITRWAVDAFPGRVIGHYSLFPLRDYWTPQSDDPKKWAAWRRANGYVKKIRDASGRFNSVGLSDLSHITMPSLYTFYDDQAGWVKYAKANIAEARKFGKPVVPFLWPRFHPGGKGSDHHQGIPGDYWRLQLDTLADCGIDEAVIWDAPEWFADGGGEVWTDETPWIKATREYREAA